MKTKPTKTGAEELSTIIHPNQIIAAHIRPAIKPFTERLLESAKLDRELGQEMERTHPDGVKKAAAELFERAAGGDAAAEKEIRDEGGIEEWKRKRAAFFDLARAKHEAACIASAPLWQEVSDAVMAAIDAAAGEIKTQWTKVCEHLGEPSDLSRWDGYCRNLKNGIRSAPFNAEKLRHGTDWQLRALGLAEIVGLE